jgi:hypothetical protein
VHIQNGIVSRQTGRKSAARYLPSVLVTLTYLLAGARLFRLISRYSVNILLWDQWDVDDATLFERHSLWEMFRWQYGPHRQGLGALVQKAIDPAMHWNSRYESFAIGAIIFLAAALALWLKVRLSGGIGYADAVIPLLFLTPLQYERVMAAINPTQGPLPMLLAVLYCFCWVIPSYRWKYAGILLANFLLTYTGYAVFFGFITPGLLALDYWGNTRHLASGERWWTGAAVALSIASLASFFVGYRFQPAVDCFSAVPTNPANYLRYVGMMFVHVGGFRIGNLTLAAVVGVMVLLALGAGVGLAVRRMLRGSEMWARDAAIVALLAYVAVFCLSAAYGRECLGLRDATSSRHTEWLVLGFFGLYLSAMSISGRWWRGFLVALLVVFSLHSAKRLNRMDAGELRGISEGKRVWRECYLARRDIPECDAASGFRIHPNPKATHLREKLDFVEGERLNLFDGPR